MAYRDDEIMDFIAKVEAAHFRTDADTGANEQALVIWNQVRRFAGLPKLNKADLPSYCHCCKHYHIRPSQVVRGDRGYEQSLSCKI